MYIPPISPLYFTHILCDKLENSRDNGSLQEKNFFFKIYAKSVITKGNQPLCNAPGENGRCTPRERFWEAVLPLQFNLLRGRAFWNGQSRFPARAPPGQDGGEGKGGAAAEKPAAVMRLGKKVLNKGMGCNRIPMPRKEEGKIHMKIGIGIDTGGTCTDAVAYDFDTGTVLAKAKELTTREDLSVGIGRALDALPRELIREASLISLSTTLATNACVENKGGRAKLLIFGMTNELLRRLKAEAQFGLRSDSVLGIDTHGSFDGLVVDEPDWDSLLERHGGWLADADALAAAELYSMNNGAVCEKRAKKLVEEHIGLPFVGASELTSDLNVLARGATALLNARLLPVVREFLEAALADFARRQCKAPVMIVRSDGSLMSAALSLRRPVETILSGPAASVLAGRSFAGAEDYLVIDMGGTTTDVSVVRGGKPVMAEGGIHIGNWQTHVKGVFVDTFALGGDSAVRLEEERLCLSPRRVMPICAASQRWPAIKESLSDLLRAERLNLLAGPEFYYLVREPADAKQYRADELALIAALRNGPGTLNSLREAAGADFYHFSAERLEAEGVVMRIGLTPTDFMHIKGDYTAYDRLASELAARVLLRLMGRAGTPEALAALADEVYGLVERKLFENLLRILLGQQYPEAFARGLDAQAEFLIREAWTEQSAGEGAICRYAFGTKAALVGLGAPTHVFLPAVAKALGTGCILPGNAEVANAIGALKADIEAAARVEITHYMPLRGGAYYVVHAPSGGHKFEDLDAAIEAAKAASEEAARKEARARGALGRLAVRTQVKKESALNRWGARVDMGCTVVSEVTVRFGEQA